MVYNESATIIGQVTNMLEACRYKLSDMGPVEWAEQNMRITSGQYQGPLSYDLTPHWREIVEALGPYSGIPEVVLMSNAQGGKTKAIIEAIICYYMSQFPRNIGYYTGHQELSEDSITSLDSAIDSCGIRHLIKAQSQKKRNSRTGDTARVKEFLRGILWAGNASNHKIHRQKAVQLAIADDIEAAHAASAKSGSTVQLIRTRTNSFGDNKKIFWCSSPETKDGIIYPLYMKGDQRRRHVPCPLCATGIVLEFEVPIPGSSETGGIKWQTDKTDRMIPGSVEYVCQSCGHGFKEKYKYEMNRAGVWIPDQPNPENPKLVSFQMSGLYSPPGMDGWETLAREYREAHPENQPIKESEAKAFYNTRMGLPFESVKEKLSATSIMQNQRQYSPGVVPERLSMADGNGRIVMLTCGADTGGKVEDGRLDYEVIAWSETGATYSVWHGSIGTFVSRENNLKEIEDREKWTYTSSPLNNIWKDFEEKVLSREFPIDGDDDNATMRIYATGIDYGAGTHRDYVIDFVDRTRYTVYGVKGNKEHRLIRLGVNTPLFEVSKAGNNRYLLQVNQYKDDVSDYMQLFWDRRSEQPANFMNYPQSEGGLYQLKGFFEHYEAEERKAVTKPNGDVEYRWTNDHFRQNHFWDCRIYNLGICDIIVYLTCKASKLNNPTYAQFVAIATA